MTENHRHAAPEAITAVIAAMEHYDRAWQRELAEFHTAHGEIDQSRQGEYEHAKDDHAWPVLDALPAWIAALKAALAAPTAPETAPEPAP
jgi:hypothetical protein